MINSSCPVDCCSVSIFVVPVFGFMIAIIDRYALWVGGTTGCGSASDQQSTNDRKVAGSRPIKVVCITVLTGNRKGWTARCGRPPLLLPSCRKLEFRLSALMDSDLALVNGKSGRQSWRYADAFQRSIISEAIYHFLPNVLWTRTAMVCFSCVDGYFHQNMSLCTLHICGISRPSAANLAIIY